MGKVLNIKLESTIDFKFTKTEEKNEKIIENFYERYEFIENFRNKEYNRDDTPAYKYIEERPIINCPYTEGILEKLKNELITVISKEYKDYKYGDGIKIIFYGNFKQPLILDDSCDTAKITIMREKQDKDKIQDYLDVILYKE